MRNALIGILLAATAATPVLAQDVDRDEARQERARAHYERMGQRNQARSDQRQQAQTQRAERQSAPAAPAQVQEVAQRQQAWRGQGSGGWQGRRGGGDQGWQGRRAETQAPVQEQGRTRQDWSGRSAGSDARAAWQREIAESREASRRSAEGTPARYQQRALENQQRYERHAREERQQSYRRDGQTYRREGDYSRDGQSYRRDGDYSRDGQSYRRDGDYRRDGWQQGRQDHRRWAQSWRNDNRYDWQRYRSTNGSIFRSGGYYAPYRGHRYSRISIGLFLGSPFYSNRYWLQDPWQYRLPAAPYGTQWVRYYDDVLLIDVYTGEVLDVIYDFFW